MRIHSVIPLREISMVLLLASEQVHAAANPCSRLASPLRTARGVDRNLIVRDPSTQNWEDPVFKSMEASVQKSLSYFDRVLWAPGSLRLDEESFKKEFARWMDEAHRLANYSKGSYHAALHPGVRRDRAHYVVWNPKSRRTEAVIYFNKIAKDLGIGPMTEGALPIRDLEETDWPSNSPAGVHRYPEPGAVQAYINLASEYLYRIRALIQKGDLDSARALIGHYYHVLVNAHPYENVNNSLFANQMIYLLKLTGHPGVAHGDLDHLLMRMTSEQVEVFWPKVLQGRVKNATAYGITVK
ncbi:MAG: hypothetical protein EBX52_05030 [Proteobacteria bacterium]|nr:hypothetical protein [Pseudomonadota bacterium]